MLKKEPPKKEQTPEQLFKNLHAQDIDVKTAEQILNRLAETRWNKKGEFETFRQKYVKEMLDAYRIYRLTHGREKNGYT
jgi:signal recognition particle GTPase